MCGQGCQETLNKRNSLDAGYWNGGLMDRSTAVRRRQVPHYQLSQPFLLAGAESVVCTRTGLINGFGKGTPSQAAEKVDAALDFGWRSGSPLR